MTCYLDREAATSRHSSCIEAQVAVILRSANGCNFFKHAFERVQYSREGVSFANGGLHDYTFSVTTIDLLHKSPALNGRAVTEQIPACAGIGIRLRTTFFARAGGGLQG